MNTNINRISILLLLVIASSVSGCYDKFDADSYKPPFTVNGFSAVDEIKSTSLIAYFPFDGSLGETISGATGSNTGTSFISGFKGQGINLKGADKSYLTFDTPAAVDGMESFTISFWVNPTFIDTDSNNGIDGILGFVNLSNPTGFWGNIDWFVENDNPSPPNGDHSNNEKATIKVHIQGTATQDTWVTVERYKGLFGVWSNHTLTYDATTSQFIYYINGSKVQTATSSWTGPINFAGSGPMVFGTVQFQTTPSIGCCGNQDWASYLTGAMDEIRIYNTALAETEVNALVVLQGKGK
jgi:hypothetical protein